MTVSFVAILSLIVSILSIVSFCFLFETVGTVNFVIRIVWIITGIVSIILPIISKWHRNKNGFGGKAAELLALIIGFFGFNFVMMYTTSINGSVISIIAILFVVIYSKSFNSVWRSAESQSRSSPSEEILADDTMQTAHHVQVTHPIKRTYPFSFWLSIVLSFFIIFISLFAFLQTKKLYETEELLETALASEDKYWAGYCDGNDVGYRHGYFLGVRDVLLETHDSSLLYRQYERDILSNSTDLDYNTWLKEKIGYYMTGYHSGFTSGEQDFENNRGFNDSYGGRERTSDKMNASRIGGLVDGYIDGYANAAYPND